MVGCAAYNCTNSSIATKGVALFKFPDDESRKKAWLENIKRDKFKPLKHSRLCQEHFEDDCFQRSPKLMNLFNVSFKLELKETAIPTKFDRGSPKAKCHVKGKTKFQSAITKKKKLQPVLSPKKYRTHGQVRGAFNKRKRQEVSSLMQTYKLLIALVL